MKAPLKTIILFLWEIAKVAVISLVIIIPVRYFLIQPFFVRGTSMEPNFQDGEYLIVNEFGYRFSPPKRGDVIVLRCPLDPSQYYIKRVVGLPGETVEIKNGSVFIYSELYPEGVKLDESKYLKDIKTPGDLKREIHENEYFVLGDNRTASSDSRNWGVLPSEFIVGKAWIRAFPFNEFSLFKTPQYGYLK